MKLTEIEKYQYTTIVFGIAVIVLAILLMRAKTTIKSGNTDTYSSDIKGCNSGIAEWLTKYPTGTAPTLESQNALVEVLTTCTSSSASSATASTTTN